MPVVVTISIVSSGDTTRVPVATSFPALSQLRDVGSDIVISDAEDATGTVPTPPFRGARDRVVREVVFAVLPHVTGPGGIDGRARAWRRPFHHWPLGASLCSGTEQADSPGHPDSQPIVAG